MDGLRRQVVPARLWDRPAQQGSGRAGSPKPRASAPLSRATGVALTVSLSPTVSLSLTVAVSGTTRGSDPAHVPGARSTRRRRRALRRQRPSGLCRLRRREPLRAPQPLQQRTNGLAIASLVCGIGGFLFLIPAILGIIFGFIARSQIRNSNGEQKGSGMALAGIIVGFAWVAILVLEITLSIALRDDRQQQWCRRLGAAHGTAPPRRTVHVAQATSGRSKDPKFQTGARSTRIRGSLRCHGSRWTPPDGSNSLMVGLYRTPMRLEGVRPADTAAAATGASPRRG